MLERTAAITETLLAIDRENEHQNSVAAAEAGVGARVIDYVPDRSLLVLEFIEGKSLSQLIADQGWKLLPDYTFAPHTGLWHYRAAPVDQECPCSTGSTGLGCGRSI